MSTFTIQSVNINVTHPIHFTLETMTPKFDLRRMNLADPDLTFIYHVAVQDITFDLAKIPVTDYITQYIKDNLKGLLTMLLAYELEDKIVSKGPELNRRFDNTLSYVLDSQMIKKQLTDKANDFLRKEIFNVAKNDLRRIVEGEDEAGQSKITEESDGTYRYQTSVHFDQETRTLTDEEGELTYPIGDVTMMYSSS